MNPHYNFTIWMLPIQYQAKLSQVLVSFKYLQSLGKKSVTHLSGNTTHNLISPTLSRSLTELFSLVALLSFDISN